MALARSLVHRARTNLPRYFTQALPTELAFPMVPNMQGDVVSSNYPVFKGPATL